MKEIWLPIKDYVGLYEVSNLGNVRSLNYKRTGQTKLLSLCNDKDGYLYVTFGKKHYKVHRLVAEAFIPNWFDEQQINHIDEDKTNNNVDNLEWCTQKYNNNYGTHKTVNERTKSKKVFQFNKNGEFIKEWSSTNEAGRNGYNQGAVASCCRGEIKSHKGFVWRYKEVS